MSTTSKGFQRENVTWTLDAYAGEGRLRLRPFLDLADPSDRAQLESLTARVYDIVLEAGGTISSSQACGLVRTQFLHKQYNELVQVFRKIKDAFDPANQLNPNKVIEDDPLVLDGMCGLFRSWGYQLLVAGTYDEALVGIAKPNHPPALIVSDYHLPGGKTGIEVIEALRRTFSAEIPAFLVSGDISPELLGKAHASGYHLLHKPVDPMKLRAMVSYVLREQQVARAD